MLKILFLAGVFVVMLALILIATSPSRKLNFKDRVVGNAQHGDAHYQTPKESRESYLHVRFGEEKQIGFVVGVDVANKEWIVDASDSTVMVQAPPGAGKTTSLYIPNAIYNIRVNRHTDGKGASMLFMDIKGDLFRILGPIFQEYGFRTPILDLRDVFHSSHLNPMQPINEEMDACKREENPVQAAMHYAKAEEYTKVLSGTIIPETTGSSSGDSSKYFCDTARNLLTGITLLVAKYGGENQRHLISVIAVINDLAGANETGASAFQLQSSKLAELMENVDDLQIRLYIGAAASADIRTVQNIISSAMANLLKFVDAELEQLICNHDHELDADEFLEKPTAVFLIMPDENTTKNFLPSIYSRFLTNDIIRLVETRYGGKCPRPFLYFMDEFGNYYVYEVVSFFTAIRGRGGRAMAAIQTRAQVISRYGKDVAQTIFNSCQMYMTTYIGPMDQDSGEAISKMMGTQTILSGSKTVAPGGKVTTSTQMIGRALESPDQLVRTRTNDWIIQKTGQAPLKAKLPGYWRYLDLPAGQAKRPSHAYEPVKVLSAELLQARINGEYVELTRGMFDRENEPKLWDEEALQVAE